MRLYIRIRLKKNIGIAGLGNKRSLGVPSPIKGKKLVDILGEEKAKIRCQNISIGRSGKPTASEKHKLVMADPELRARMSQSQKRRFLEHPEVKLNHNNKLKEGYASGRIKHWARGLTSETDERIRLKTIKHGNTIRGISKPECGRSGIEHHMFGKTYDELYEPEMAERLKKIRSDNIQRLIREPEYIKKHLEGMKLKPNKKEIKLDKIIKEVTPDYGFNGDYRLGISFDGLIPDFWNVNGKKKVIEMLGEHWHGEKMRKHSKEEEENIKIARYAKCGVDCLIIWESELKYPDKVKGKVIQYNNK
jgi:hypothetical protein